MTIIAYIPILVAILGLLLYLLASNPKVQELGRLLFACGALVALLGTAGQAVRIGSAAPVLPEERISSSAEDLEGGSGEAHLLAAVLAEENGEWPIPAEPNVIITTPLHGRGLQSGRQLEHAQPLGPCTPWETQVYAKQKWHFLQPSTLQL